MGQFVAPGFDPAARVDALVVDDVAERVEGDGLDADGLEAQLIPGEAFDDGGVGAFDGADERGVVLSAQGDECGLTCELIALAVEFEDVEVGGGEDGDGEDGDAGAEAQPPAEITAVEPRTDLSHPTNHGGIDHLSVGFGGAGQFRAG